MWWWLWSERKQNAFKIWLMTSVTCVFISSHRLDPRFSWADPHATRLEHHLQNPPRWGGTVPHPMLQVCGRLQVDGIVARKMVLNVVRS